MGILPQELPWYIVGPLIGCVVVGMYAVTNQPIGASGSYAQLTDKILGKAIKEPWRLYFMMGYGARWMGGCTSGHGLCGTAIRSSGSYVATAAFFLTAVVVTYVIHFVTGGFI